MGRLTASRPSPALIVAVLALAAALAGTAIAEPSATTSAVSKKKIKKISKKEAKKQIKKRIPWGTNDIADAAITGPKLAPNAVDGSKVADNSLNDTKMSDYELIGNSFILVNATDGADEAAARAAAPETVLFSKGQLEIYAKCFRSTATNTTFAEIISRTSQDGSVQEGTDDLPGGNSFADFLNTGTLEVDRTLANESATGNDANYDEAEWALASPDGTGLNGQDVVGAKNGNLAGGNGIYGDGNVCLFQGSILG